MQIARASSETHWLCNEGKQAGCKHLIPLLVQEEVAPSLTLPDGLKPTGLDVRPEEIVFDPPLAPSYPLQPAPPAYDKPQHGADWTGLKPFQVGLFVFAGVQVELAPFKKHRGCRLAKLVIREGTPAHLEYAD